MQRRNRRKNKPNTNGTQNNDVQSLLTPSNNFSVAGHVWERYVGLGIALLFATMLVPWVYLWTQNPEEGITHAWNCKNPMERTWNSDQTRRQAWVDFLADTGDGWSSTFAVASAVSQSWIKVGNISLPQASTLIIGGDLMYPHPTRVALKNRLQAPYATAFFATDTSESKTFEQRFEDAKNATKCDMVEWLHYSRVVTLIYEKVCKTLGCKSLFSMPASKHFTEIDQGNPKWFEAWRNAVTENIGYKLYAIPGNHDVLDRKVAEPSYWLYQIFQPFLDLDECSSAQPVSDEEIIFDSIIKQRRFAGWILPQNRLYWAFEQCDDWLILGIYDQYHAGDRADIDNEQLEYFQEWLSPFEDRKRVMIVMHSPFWIPELPPLGNLTSSLIEMIKRKHSLRVIVAGDMHYYAHHVPKDPNLPHLFVSGGGGAFLHSTNHIPEKLHVLGGSYKLQSVFPPQQTSRIVTRGLLSKFWYWFWTAIILVILLMCRCCCPCFCRQFWCQYIPYYTIAVLVLTVALCGPLISLHFGIAEGHIFAAIGDPNFKHFIRFHLCGEGQAFVVGIKKSFPENIQYSYSTRSEFSWIGAQMEFPKTWLTWFENNLVLVEKCALDSGFISETATDDEWCDSVGSILKYERTQTVPRYSATTKNESTYFHRWLGPGTNKTTTKRIHVN